MIFEDVFRQLLVQINVVGTRVFLMRAPQTPASQMQVPYLVFLPIGQEPLHSHQGPLDLQIRNYQISIFDTSQSRALGIADTIREALDGFRGDYQGVQFGAIFYRTQTSGYEEDTRLHQVMMDFRILFQIPAVLSTVSTTVVNTERKEAVS